MEQTEISNLFDRGMRGSILTTSFHFFKITAFYTSPPLVKRRIRGCIFLFLQSLHSFSRCFGEKPWPGYVQIRMSAPEGVVRSNLLFMNMNERTTIWPYTILNT